MTVGTAIVLVLALIPYDSFFDNAAYLFYLDDLYWYPVPGQLLSEPASKLFLLGLRWLTNSTADAVQDAHFVIGAVYLIGTLAAFRPTRSDPRALLVAFALYGPQLAFVTLRATPAYMLVTLAALDASVGRKRCFAFLIGAFLFHVSTALAVIPVVLAYFQHNSRLFSWAERPKNLLIAAGIISLLLLFVRQFVFDLVETVVSSIPFLGKYVIFLVGLSNDNGSTKSIVEFSLGHFILFGGLSLAVFTFLVMLSERGKRLIIYITSSYFIYVFSFFALSPIAAWRQSAFWALPMFAVFPWARLGWRGAAWIPAVAVLAGVFWFQLSAVYS